MRWPSITSAPGIQGIEAFGNLAFGRCIWHLALAFALALSLPRRYLSEKAYRNTSAYQVPVRPVGDSPSSKGKCPDFARARCFKLALRDPHYWYSLPGDICFKFHPRSEHRKIEQRFFSWFGNWDQNFIHTPIASARRKHHVGKSAGRSRFEQ